MFRYRVSLALFLLGLIFSGLTAFPLLTEIHLLSSMMGITDATNYPSYTGLVRWIAYVQLGLEETYARYPFFGYGTDWLAFGHFASAAFLIHPLRKPLESDWVIRTALWICAAVIPTAFIAGQIRGVPVSWRLIDSGFGFFGALPLFYCLHLTRRMRES